MGNSNKANGLNYFSRYIKDQSGIGIFLKSRVRLRKWQGTEAVYLDLVKNKINSVMTPFQLQMLNFWWCFKKYAEKKQVEF